MLKALKSVIRSRLGQKLSTALFRLASRANPALAQATRVGDVPPVPEALAEMLAAIPSETSVAERHLLYRYFADHWTGNGNVVEIGPFLGGTTRAIALGMTDNPRRDPAARLLTFDRFHGYYGHEQMKPFLQPLLDAGQIAASDLPRDGDRFDLRPIFEAIHAATSYRPMIEVSDLPVPDLPDELRERKDFLRIQSPVSAVFVDGCKSWFGTKYFMREAGANCLPGAPIFFQDYLCRTCFWIPAFVEIFRDKLRLFARAGDTRAFLLAGPLDPADVEARFPDQPDGFSRRELGEIFDRLIERAQTEADSHEAFVHTLHKAGALASIGERGEARALLHGIDARKLAPAQRAMLASAKISPTYTPAGRIHL